MSKRILTILAFLFVLACAAYRFYPKASSSKNDKEESDLPWVQVNQSGQNATINVTIEENTLSPQISYESDILKAIFRLIKGGNVNRIQITISDYCKDYYGHTIRRYWHKTVKQSWELWNEVSKYANAEDFATRNANFYPISRNTEEGEFLCCGRDRSCN